MSPTSEFMAQVSLAHSYQELFRVTGPLQSIVLRTEDMWRRHNQYYRSWRDSQSGFPLLTPKKETYDGPMRVWCLISLPLGLDWVCV
jgi:hypothetical protein